ncbi:glycosyltransferase [Accumulibacter sp.]|uniref:glycosyltransferase n=1 Tax=Accumulibacter sp. TaxID=2053492 RepID=UPI0025D6FBFC|nr:glycosyltransferase [Accumulibacter sp.]MCM8593929.1 glycosyltransferase [Accumulibacter sp.]MCM8627778.1 glycosyltransferase [Accumulibacter sp.]MDS4048070.1 glycosyltransferase [Accumulibacter sp.]
MPARSEASSGSMRVIQVIGSTGGGGAEAFFVRLSNALHEAGENLVAVSQPCSQVAGELLPGLPQQHVRMRGVWDLWARWCLKRIIGQVQPAIVQTWMGRATRLVSLPRGRRPIHLARLGGYYNLRGYRHAHAWVGNTAGVCDYLVRNGFPAGRVHHVGNFVDLAQDVDPLRRLDLRQQYGVPEEAMLIVSAGRLHPIKGFSDLLGAFSVLPPSVGERPVWLLIAGAGEMAFALRDQAGHLGIGQRLCWAGWQRDIGQVLDIADIVVCPSRQETLGNVILEAWAHGKPVVSTATQGALEIVIDEHNGLIVPCARPDDLASALRELLTADERTRSSLGEAGRSTVRLHHGRQAVVDQYRALYRQLAGSAADA